MASKIQAASRQRNLSEVLIALHERGPIRQVDLSDEMSLARTTGISLVEELVEERRALKELIGVVRGDADSNEMAPTSASEWLARSYALAKGVIHKEEGFSETCLHFYNLLEKANTALLQMSAALSRKEPF